MTSNPDINDGLMCLLYSMSRIYSLYITVNVLCHLFNNKMNVLYKHGKKYNDSLALFYFTHLTSAVTRHAPKA